MAKMETKLKNIIKEMKETAENTQDKDQKKFRELQTMFIEISLAIQTIIDIAEKEDCTEDEANAALEAYLGKMLRLNMMAESLVK